MSHDIDLIDTTHSGQSVTVYTANWTYNYTPALNEAGLHWSDCDGKRAHEIAPTVATAYGRILADREKYRPLIRGGGSDPDTGTVERLIDMLEEFNAACSTHYAAQFERL